VSRPRLRGKGNLRRGPFTAKDDKHALKCDGWKESTKSGKGHQGVWEHPTKPGKFPVSESWTGLRAWDPILKGMVRTCGIDKERLLRLLNGNDE
jgi:hypothetical protein